MSAYWPFFALSGPLLWAVSTHLDKSLVEQYFKHTHPAVLLILTALTNLLALPLIWAWVPAVASPEAQAIILMTLSGILLMAAMLFYL
jgi:hypothetical protein